MAIDNQFRTPDFWIKRGIIITLLGVASALLVACGGGGTAGTNVVGGNLQIQPATADLYENQPTTFTISGGTKPYTVFSSNSAILPLTTTVADTTFVAIANSPSTDTTVTITVRDNAGATATATASVKASALNNSVSITPTAAGQSCGTAVCAGGDALVSTTSTLNGTLLANRSIRFDVYVGEFSLVTPGTNALVNSLTVSTGSNGIAQAVIRANPGAKSQTAIVQATDLVSGQVRRFSFAIQQQTTSTEITITPNNFNWTGAYTNACAVGAVTSHYIFGGTPPYRIQQTIPNFASMAGSPAGPTPDQTQYPGAVSVAISGGAVLVSTTGLVCSTGANGDTFTVTDAQNRTATFTIGNQVGSGTPPATGSLNPPTLNPTSVTNLDCGLSTSVFVTQTIPSGYNGAAPTLSATSLEPLRVTANLANGILTVTRLGTSAGGLGQTIVRVTNGLAYVDLPITLSGTAPFACNIGNSSTTPVTLSTSNSITLHLATAGVNPIAPSSISGGVAPYTVTTAAPAIATVSNDGGTYANSVVINSVSTPFFVKGLSPGVTFVSVTDSTPAASGGPQTTVLVVTVVTP